MHNRTIVSFLFCFLLAACNTTVVTEEERELPDPPTPPVEEVAEPESTAEDEGMAGDEQDAMEDEQAMEDTAIPEVWTADLSQSFLAFTGAKGNVVSHEGKFEDFTFEMMVPDPDNLSTADIELIVQISSMLTDSDRLTDHLLNEDFFAAGEYGTAKFQSTAVSEEGAGDYMIDGNLTIKGVTKPVRFKAKLTDQYLTMNYNLDRTAFGVGGPAEGAKAINATVPVEAKIVFSK